MKKLSFQWLLAIPALMHAMVATATTDTIHYPDRGSGPATINLLGGQISLPWVSLLSVA